MNILFDFDGTIANTLEKGVEVMNSLLKEENKNLITAEEIRSKGVKQIVQTRKLSKLKISILLLKARSGISRHMEDLPIHIGLVDIFKKISSKNTLGIISSNSKENILVFLKSKNIEQYFSFIDDEKDWLGKDKKIKHVLHHQNLQINETFYVGDECRDIDAAKKAGVKSVAVTWGFESKEILRTSLPDYIVGKPDELLKIFK